MEFWATAGSDDPTACWAPASDECNPDVYFDADNEAAAVKYLGSHGVDHVHALVDGRMDGWQMISTYDNYDACGYGDFVSRGGVAVSLVCFLSPSTYPLRLVFVCLCLGFPPCSLAPLPSFPCPPALQYPNLSNLTDAELVTLGGKLASLYCRSDVISGVQVDLEPFTEPYEASLTLFIAATSAAMRSEEGNAGNGCVSDAHPDGRAVSYFTFAHSQSHDFGTSALGANGFFVFSMYDLDPKPADGGMMYNTVAEFKEKLRYELNYIPAVVGSNVHFTMAVPISASCHEYEQYVPGPQPGCGPACTPETNTAKMHEYVQGMFDVLLSDDVRSAFGNLFCMNSTAQSQFLGLSFWVYTPECSYPPMRWFSNNFLPTTPTASVDAVLHEHLHKLSSSALCAPPDTYVCCLVAVVFGVWCLVFGLLTAWFVRLASPQV